MYCTYLDTKFLLYSFAPLIIYHIFINFIIGSGTAAAVIFIVSQNRISFLGILYFSAFEFQIVYYLPLLVN